MARTPFRAALLAALLLAGSAPWAGQAQPEPKLPHRWVYIAYNLLPDRNVRTVQGLLRRAQAAGYNGALIADYKFATLDQQPPEYFRNVEAVRATARELGIELTPAVCPVGYSHGLLSHNPNLAEGIPVRDALFVAREGQAGLQADPPVELPGGDFETAQGDRVAGWDLQDFPGQASFADPVVFHGGKQSLRMENVGTADPQYGHGRVSRRVAVAPFRQYHLSVWIRTEMLARPNAVRATVLSTGRPQRTLSYAEWRVRGTQDWTQYHAVFNSLDNRQVAVYLGMWQAGDGRIWWDDARLEEVGLLNVLRRPGCPVEVRGENGTVYEEGRDFERAADPRMGRVPYAGEYEVYHPAPPLRLTAGTRIREGERLRVSFHSVILIHSGQVTCCLSDPGVYTLLKDQVERIQRLFRPRGFFMSHDEIRVANWCRTCQERGLTPGQLLADNTRRCVDLIRAANPQAEVYVWSDMYDPNHNAVDNYYLVNGTWSGSWEGLPRDVTVANWQFGQRQKSLPWFAARGNPQLLAGYYDSDPARIRTWLDDARGVKGLAGVMYTTWQDRYQDLEAFAKAAWGTP